MKMKTKLLAVALSLFVISAIRPDVANAAPAVNLNQARNGTALLPANPMNWVNGNIGVDQGHYNEEMSAPFQCIMTGMTSGIQVTLTIGYDIKNSNRHAFDYLTHYNRILPHTFGAHSTPETIDPLSGTGLSAATPYSTYSIPAPSASGSPVAGQPVTSFNSLFSDERLMTIYNGTIDNIAYVVQGSLTAANSETRVAITFTPSAATVVLLWGGHIGSRNDWGYTSGFPNSAGGISGSPFHMRLVSWTLGNIGNQDRSLAGPAVGAPPSQALPVELVQFTVNGMNYTNSVEWSTASEINNDYFNVERSADGINFEPIGKVEGAGNSSTKMNYAWIDFNPLSGVSYYRLVQNDFDGAQKIYGPLSVRRNENSSTLSVTPAYPNPFTNDIMISYSSPATSATLIEMNDAAGNNVLRTTIDSDKGENSFRYSGFELSEGIYFITISQPDEKPVTTVVIKH
jgi:hypothetical protein